MSSRRGAVLAGVQDTRGGRRALEWAWEEALLRDTSLEVLDVVADDSLRDDAEAGLVRMVQTARAHHERAPRVVTEVVVGDPVEVLVARSSAVALLVVGSHGVSGILHAVQPASSDALSRLADCPVVVVPSPSPAPMPSRAPEPEVLP
jgi:nucleotide-binding universal stress UspA family protein